MDATDAANARRQLARCDESREHLRATAAGLAAASLVAGLGIWLLVAPAPSGPRSAPSIPTAPSPEWLRVVPPAIALYSPGLLAMQGRNTASFSDAFDEAMAPWQAGSYAEAALRLEVLARQYPEFAESHFFLGAAWLLAGVTDEALGPLSRSVALAPPLLSGEARWYLGLALLQAGQQGAALRAVTAGCEAGHAEACRAVAYLSPLAARP